MTYTIYAWLYWHLLFRKSGGQEYVTNVSESSQKEERTTDSDIEEGCCGGSKKDGAHGV